MAMIAGHATSGIDSADEELASVNSATVICSAGTTEWLLRNGQS